PRRLVHARRPKGVEGGGQVGQSAPVPFPAGRDPLGWPRSKGVRMKLASFNINGVRARVHALDAWLEVAEPDLVVLQEIKTEDAGFPRQHYEDKGWTVATHGQK